MNHCVKTDSAQKCQDACQNGEAGCVAFTWIGTANNGDDNCCLITSMPDGNARSVAGFVSGPKDCGKLLQKRHQLS